MRRRGTGTIEEMRDGTFRARMPGAGGRLRRCAQREEAEALLDAAIAELAEGSMVDPGGATLRSFGPDFLDDRELAELAGVGTDRSRWRTHIETAYFYDWPLRTIASFDVRQWLATVMAKIALPGRGQKKIRHRKLGRSTVQNTLNLLRCCFAAAIEAQLIDDNPAKDVSLPRDPGRTHDPWTYLEPAEQEVLLDCEEIPEADRLLIAFAMGTGLRQGELWNLPRKDVRLDEGKVVVRFGSKGKATKGRRIRRIPLFGLAREAWERWIELLPTRPNPHALAWPTKGGARRQRGKRPAGWDEYLRVAGIKTESRHDGMPVRWHDLRHTCGSSLVAGWWGRRWSLIEVREMLGHRSVTTTERYAHLAESALDEAARETDLSTNYPRDVSDISSNLPSGGNHSAPPARIGRATFGLGRRCDPELLREVKWLRGLIVDSSRLAAEALGAIERDAAHGWTEAIRKLGSIVAKATELETAASTPPNVVRLPARRA